MSDRLVTIATYQDPVAATLAKNYLEHEGIASILIDETTIATDWMLSGAIGGVKLQVAVLDVERAEMLLERIDAEREQDAPPPVPPTAVAAQELAEDLQAEQADRAEINQLADRVFRTAVFGLILWPLQLYALYLLLAIWLSAEKVSPDRRWKVWAAACMNVPLLSVVIVPLLCLLDAL
jgi:hypothetical protein